MRIDESSGEAERVRPAPHQVDRPPSSRRRPARRALATAAFAAPGPSAVRHDHRRYGSCFGEHQLPAACASPGARKRAAAGLDEADDGVADPGVERGRARCAAVARARAPGLRSDGRQRPYRGDEPRARRVDYPKVIDRATSSLPFDDPWEQTTMDSLPPTCSGPRRRELRSLFGIVSSSPSPRRPGRSRLHRGERNDSSTRRRSRPLSSWPAPASRLLRRTAAACAASAGVGDVVIGTGPGSPERSRRAVSRPDGIMIVTMAATGS